MAGVLAQLQSFSLMVKTMNRYVQKGREKDVCEILDEYIYLSGLDSLDEPQQNRFAEILEQSISDLELGELIIQFEELMLHVEDKESLMKEHHKLSEYVLVRCQDNGTNKSSIFCLGI